MQQHSGAMGSGDVLATDCISLAPARPLVTDYLGSLYRGVDLFRTMNAQGLLHQLAGDVGLPDCISRSAAPYKEAQLRSRILGTCEMAVLDPCVG
jgi:hypothetical protein